MHVCSKERPPKHDASSIEEPDANSGNVVEYGNGSPCPLIYTSAVSPPNNIDDGGNAASDDPLVVGLYPSSEEETIPFSADPKARARQAAANYYAKLANANAHVAVAP